MQRTAWRTAGVLRWHPSPGATVDDLLSGDVLNLVLRDMDKVWAAAYDGMRAALVTMDSLGHAKASNVLLKTKASQLRSARLSLREPGDELPVNAVTGSILYPFWEFHERFFRWVVHWSEII